MYAHWLTVSKAKSAKKRTVPLEASLPGSQLNWIFKPASARCALFFLFFSELLFWLMSFFFIVLSGYILAWYIFLFVNLSGNYLFVFFLPFLCFSISRIWLKVRKFRKGEKRRGNRKKRAEKGGGARDALGWGLAGWRGRKKKKEASERKMQRPLTATQ